MTDDTLVNVPDIGGDNDTWGQELNDAIRVLETRINVLRQYVIDNPGGGSDAAVAALVTNVASATRIAINAVVDSRTLQLGTSHSTAAYGDHDHGALYATLVQVQAAIAAAQAGNGSGIAGAPATWPSTFPAGPHTHVRADLSDATTIAKALLGAVDAQAARAVIGAGTGNGTSNLAIGATATTAAAGNHTHNASAVTVTPSGGLTSAAVNLQAAVDELAAAMGGGGGGANLDRRYASGAYPVRGTVPAGSIVKWWGPTAPLINGTYAQSGDAWFKTVS